MNESSAPSGANGHKSRPEVAATWVAILGGIVAIVGGILALYRFFEGQAASQAKEALAHIDHFSDAAISTSYEQFHQHMKKFADAHGKEALKDPTLVVAALNDPAVTDQATVVIRFFDNVAACTCKHLCDEQLVKMFLGSQAFDVWGLTQPYIAAQTRDGSSPQGFGTGLTALALAYNTNAALDCRFVGAPAAQ